MVEASPASMPETSGLEVLGPEASAVASSAAVSTQHQLHHKFQNITAAASEHQKHQHSAAAASAAVVVDAQ